MYVIACLENKNNCVIILFLFEFFELPSYEFFRHFKTRNNVR